METRPLGKVTSIAVSAERLYVGTKDSAFVDQYSHDARLVGTIRVGSGDSPRTPTSLHYERAIDAQVAALSDRDEREQMKRLLLAIPMPQQLPPYSTLHVDPDQVLFVVTSLPGDSATALRAFAPSGRALADVHIPVELTVFEVGRDYILGAHEEASGELHVLMYRLRRDA